MTSAPPPLDVGALRGAFVRTPGASSFLLDGDGNVLLQNAEADAIAGPSPQSLEWLTGPRFFDDTGAVRLSPTQSPYAHLVIHGDPGPMPASWLDSFGERHRAVFECVTLDSPGLRLLSVVPVSDPAPATQPPRALWRSVHELGNTLGIIQLAANGLGMMQLSPDAQRKQQDILNATARANDVVRGLESGKPSAPPRLTTHNAAELIRTIGPTIRRTLPPTISLDLTAPEAPLYCPCSYSALEIAVIEMLGEARRFAADLHPDPVRIVLSAEHAAPFATVVVAVSLADTPPSTGGEDPLPATLAQAADLARTCNGHLRVERSDQVLTLSLDLPMAPEQ